MMRPSIPLQILLTIIAALLLQGCFYGSHTKSPKTFQEQTLDDVWHITSPDQRAALKKLTTDEAIKDFMDEFWANLDPTPYTPENEIQAEFEKRLAYIRKHYTDRRGWGKSDRARVYLLYGPPASIDRVPWSDFRVSDGTRLGAVEVWVYNQDRGGAYIETIFGPLYPNQMHFIFAELNGLGSYQQLFSTEPGEKIDSRVYRIGF